MVWYCKFQQPGYYDFSAVTISNYTHAGKHSIGISPIGVNVKWIYPGSISDSNITEKNLMWLAGLTKNMKSCQIKGFLNSSCQKNNPVSEVEEAAHTDCSKMHSY